MRARDTILGSADARGVSSGNLDTIGHVPRISTFYGIVIEMYFGDRAPPHFHAR